MTDIKKRTIKMLEYLYESVEYWPDYKVLDEYNHLIDELKDPQIEIVKVVEKNNRGFPHHV